jgi:uncharacterized protein (TIGR00251 family)
VLTSTPTGVILDVRVIPRAKNTQAGGVRDGSLVVRLAAPPVEGAANAALVEFLADTLRLPRHAIQILSGERGRRKRVAIAGVTAAAVQAALSQALETRT